MDSHLKPPSERRLSGLRILIVDDTEDALLMLSIALGREGARAVTADSAAEAFDLYEKLRPNVVVSDIVMPGGDGYSLIERIRAFEQGRAGRVPAVAVTGEVSEESLRRAIYAGFSAFLPRPFELEELTLVIARLVGRAGGA